jgi:hypothetical protein
VPFRRVRRTRTPSRVFEDSLRAPGAVRVLP